jgi:uncharacterized protein with beta-barrel porin domain
MKQIKYYLFILLITTSSSSYSNDPQPTQEEYIQAIVSVLGSDAQRFSQMIRSLAAYCAVGENFETGLDGHCDDLFRAAVNGNRAVVVRALKTLRPREVVQQNRMSSEIMTTQQANLSTRLTQLRNYSSVSVSDLKFVQNGQSISMDMLSYLNKDADETSNDSSLNSAWGFFLNGRISNGDYSYSDASNEGFDFGTDGITTGIDYRFSNKLVAGLALGYSNFDSNIGSDTKMNSKSNSYSVYGSYNANDNFYIDGRFSFANTDHKQSRKFEFNLDTANVNHEATGKTDGTQKSAIISAGYQYNKSSWSFTPSLSLEYYKTEVDAFVEENASGWNVGFSQQNFSTMRYVLGFQINKSISLANGVFVPYLGLNYSHENQTGDKFIFMRISGMPAGEFFNAETGFNDSNYGNTNIGFSFVSSNGKQAFLQYSQVFGWEGVDRYTVNLGLRFEF